jgi:hypothetical protein
LRVVCHARFDAHLSATPLPGTYGMIDYDEPQEVPIGSHNIDCPNPAPDPDPPLLADAVLPTDVGVPSAPPTQRDNFLLTPTSPSLNEVPRTSSNPGYYSQRLDLWCHQTSTTTTTPYPAPPGSLLDPRTTVGPEDLNDFPFLQVGLAPSTEPSPTFGDALSSLCHDCLLPHLTCMQVLVVDVTKSGRPSSLADSGANVCVTNDPSLLIDVVEINSVPLGMATSSPDAPTNPTSLCTHKGFLPIALLNGSIHYQPFLVNRHATNTIISPENLLNNNHPFHRWTQAGCKLPAGGCNYSPGDLSFYDSASQLLLSLPLQRQQGLYYCLNTTFLLDSDVTHPLAIA